MLNKIISKTIFVAASVAIASVTLNAATVVSPTSLKEISGDDPLTELKPGTELGYIGDTVIPNTNDVKIEIGSSGMIYYHFNLENLDASIDEVESSGLKLSLSYEGGFNNFSFFMLGATEDDNIDLATYLQESGLQKKFILEGDTARNIFNNNGSALLMIAGRPNSSNITISDIQVSLGTPIPEPSMFGLFAGLAALSLVGLRRRRK